MRIKRFTGNSLKEATDQMRTELGPEAIIFSTRTVNKGGSLNFLGKQVYEVTAAIDDAPASGNNTYGRPRPGTGFARQLSTAAADQQEDNPVANLQKMTERFEQRGRIGTDGASSRMTHDAEIGDLRGDMHDMKVTLKDIADQLKYAKMPALPEHLKRAYAILVEQDVDEQLAADVVQAVYARLTPEQLGVRATTETTVMNALASLVKSAEVIKSRKRKARVIAVVGPTGVGKTTTIAKLAAINKLMHHLDVALISADTYRIGAIEQLKTFAAIADMPMEVVYKPAEMTAALRKFRDKDVIFVDTVGRSQRSKKELADLAKFLDAADPDETHLVLSASTTVKTSLDVIKRFSVVKPNRLLFSKLDETVTLGAIMNIVSRQEIPVAYVTTGQAVPDDIVPVTPLQLARMVFHGDATHA